MNAYVLGLLVIVGWTACLNQQVLAATSAPTADPTSSSAAPTVAGSTQGGQASQGSSESPTTPATGATTQAPVSTTKKNGASCLHGLSLTSHFVIALILSLLVRCHFSG